MGDFPLIGASASCSSYQKPRRGRGEQLQAAFVDSIIKDTVNLVGLIEVKNCFNF